MKIGISSYSYSKYIKSHEVNYLEICDMAKASGFEGLDFIDLDKFPTAMLGDVEQTAKKIREHCEKIGLEICTYTVGAELTGENGEETVKKVMHDIDIANLLGCKTVRHDVCYALTGYDYPYSYKDAIEELVPRIRKITEYAEKLGIRTCIENHGRIFQAPERVRELIHAVDRKNYGWLCDIGNFMGVGREPAECVAIAAPYTFHVHAKDNIFKSGDGVDVDGMARASTGDFYRGTIIGHGVVPIRKCLSILKAAGYDGFVTIEFEGPEENLSAIEQGFANLKRIYETI